MAKYEHKPNSGGLFINDRKETDRHPDWRGDGLIDGVEYWISEWNVTTDKNGNPLPKDKYRKNLSFTRKDSQRAPNPQQPSEPQQPSAPLDDDIPF